MVNILISGASGNMGKAFVATCFTDDALNLVSCTSRKFERRNIYEALGHTGSNQAHGPVAYAALEDAIANSPEPIAVGVELTHPSVIFENTITLIEHGIAPIIGGTGLSRDEEMEINDALKKKQLPGMLVPNFSIGAVLMMRFAAEASRYFDHAEIVEYHHNQKADAPSGTSLRTADVMLETHQSSFGKGNMKDKEVLKGARGGIAEGNIHIHSVRLPGLVAHQEVLLGSHGQMLTLRHDSYNRECFMPGIALCCTSILKLPPGLHIGLERVM